MAKRRATPDRVRRAKKNPTRRAKRKPASPATQIRRELRKPRRAKSSRRYAATGRAKRAQWVVCGYNTDGVEYYLTPTDFDTNLKRAKRYASGTKADLDIVDIVERGALPKQIRAIEPKRV